MFSIRFAIHDLILYPSMKICVCVCEVERAFIATMVNLFEKSRLMIDRSVSISVSFFACVCTYSCLCLCVDCIKMHFG